MDKELLTDVSKSAEEVDRDLMDKWLTFWIDGQLYGASVVYVEGIISMMPVTTVPEYPDYAKGIINLRGSIIPLIDLRLRFGKPEAEYTDKTCIINCRVGENQIGFIVDEVDAVIDIPEDRVSNPPRMVEDLDKRYLTGIARVVNEATNQEKIILCLDVTKVLCREEISGLIKE